MTPPKHWHNFALWICMRPSGHPTGADLSSQHTQVAAQFGRWNWLNQRPPVLTNGQKRIGGCADCDWPEFLPFLTAGSNDAMSTSREIFGRVSFFLLSVSLAIFVRSHIDSGTSLPSSGGFFSFNPSVADEGKKKKPRNKHFFSDDSTTLISWPIAYRSAGFWPPINTQRPLASNQFP